MALHSFNRHPSPADLRSFGRLLVPFVVLVGGVVRWRTGSTGAAAAVWVVGGLLAAAYLAVPAARRPIFLGWTGVAFPIGWVVSHLVLGAVFYLVFTPIGWLVRRINGDPLQRRFEASRPSYWIERPAGTDVGRYLKQF